MAAIGRAMPGPAYVKHKIKRVGRFLRNSRVEMAAVSCALICRAARGPASGGGDGLDGDLPGDKKMTPGRALIGLYKRRLANCVGALLPALATA